jgi:hypothetical protein
MNRSFSPARRTLAALAIGVTLGYLGSSCAREGGDTPSSLSHDVARSSGSPEPAGWKSLAEPESDEARSTITTLCDRIEAAVMASHEGDPLFVRPDDLSVCARAVFTSLLNGDPGPLLEELTSRGAQPDHANLVNVAKDFAEWQLIEPLDLGDLSAEEAYRAVWATRRQRSMMILDVRPDWVDVGRGMVVNVGADAWDYSGVRACVSSVVPASGRPSWEEGEAAEGTNASAHVCIRVRYSDGHHGQLRVNFMFLRPENRWYPISLAVGSSAMDQWPFPFY